MTYTKQDVLAQAFEELGLAGYIFDITPDELVSALRRLDSMMSTRPWNILDHTDGLEALTGMEAGGEYRDAIAYNLAVRLAPQFGKTPPTLTLVEAKKGLGTVAALWPIPTASMSSRTPRGAGNRGGIWSSAFYPQTVVEDD